MYYIVLHLSGVNGCGYSFNELLLNIIDVVTGVIV
jgi:hypothetical protein